MSGEAGPIGHVSDTSFWVAAYRARETERADALFKDPFAAVLAGERGRTIAKRMGNASVMAWVVTTRTLVIDAYVREAIARGVDTILNLGAGLDTRPYRLDVPENLRWIEVDFPAVIDYKSRALGGEPSKCDLERIALDLSNVDERERLFGQIASRAEKVLVLTEGVIPYLANDEVASLAASLLERRNFKYWITEYFTNSGFAAARRARMQKKLGPNSAFRFSVSDWEGFFSRNGWVTKEMRYLFEEGAKIGRLPSTGWLGRFLFRWMPEAKREELRKMTGYALLERSARTG